MLNISCVVAPGVRFPKNDDRAVVNRKLISQGSYTEITESTCLVVVCDGVGGEAFGNEAAEIVTNIFSCLGGTQLTIDLIEENVAKANKAVMAAQRADYERAKMSTTIAGLYINGDDFIAFNAGDTRIYRYRAPYIMQISTDHTVWQEQLELGKEPKPGQKSTITRYIGGSYAVPEIVDGTGRVLENDIYLICTDGVWAVLEDNDFKEILSNNTDTKEMCQTLIYRGLKKGSLDNLSVIIVRRM